MVDLHGSESSGTSRRMQHFSPYSAPFSGKQEKGVYAINTGPFTANARVVTIIPADSYASPDLNKEYDSHDSSTTSCAYAEPDFSSTSIVAVADANPSVILTDVMQPAADKTYTLFGLAKFTLLLMFTLLAAAPFLHNVQTAPLASARFDALAAAPPLHEVQTALLASTCTDALAAAPLLHKVQTAPSASARTDALAAAPLLHKMQAALSASARTGEQTAAPQLIMELTAARAPQLYELSPALSLQLIIELTAAHAPQLYELSPALSPQLIMELTAAHAPQPFELSAALPLSTNVLSPLAHQTDVLAEQSVLALNVLSPLAQQANLLFQQSALATNVLSPLALETDMLSLSALQTILLPPGEPPPCPIEGVCPGSRLDNPLSPRQLLLASAPLAAALLESISPQSYSLPMHSSLVLFMHATPSASARSDALRPCRRCTLCRRLLRPRRALTR
jgi:hypothetical protein